VKKPSTWASNCPNRPNYKKRLVGKNRMGVYEISEETTKVLFNVSLGVTHASKPETVEGCETKEFTECRKKFSKDGRQKTLAPGLEPGKLVFK